MPDATQLAQVTSWSSLLRLLATLGIRGQCHPLDPGALPEAIPGHVTRIATVHHNGILPWIVLAAKDAKAAGRAVARARSARGHPAAVACLDLSRRRLMVTVALDPAPMLDIALDQPDPVGLAALTRITEIQSLPPLEAAARLAELLAIEPPGTRFFRQFRQTFSAFRDALPAGPPPEDRSHLALLQLTRVLFLYFVQSKGWLDGRADFLARAVDDCLRRRRSLHRDLLRPLFFGALNRPAAGRGVVAGRFGRLPFLNGGLFEPHHLERRWKLDLPSSIWHEAFDGLFERFHFTTREGTGNIIAPDMLGRVFEGLMDPAQRESTGTFYTPASLVREMIDAAFLARGNRVPLAEITVLDPAAGSGAFLLGALEQLSERTRGPGESVATARRRVLGRNLFGVDLDPMAVRLAELRLWLAVIADDDTSDPAQVLPLPNLDAVVRQGDSLWSGFGMHRPAPEIGTALRRAREAVINAAGPGKAAVLRSLRRAQHDSEASSLSIAQASVERRLRDLMRGARAQTLFGERRGLGENDRAVLAQLRAEQRGLRSAQRRLARESGLGTFDYAVHFGDVMAGGGFDLVIGNPPWVRSEALPQAVRRRLTDRYQWFRPAGGRGYRNSPDLSVAFVERCLELTREDGVMALLVPGKLCHAGYATHARRALATGTTLHAVAEAPGEGTHAFDATVFPMAMVIQKSRPGPEHQVRLGLDVSAEAVAQSSLQADGPWLLLGASVARVAARMTAVHPRLGDRWRCHLGVKTGANELFLTSTPDIEPELMRRAVRGRDVRPDGIVSSKWLRWPCTVEGEPLAALPPRAASWFGAHRERLRRRADYRNGPPWTLFRTREALGAHRVIWPDLSRRLAAAPLTGKGAESMVPLNTCYVIRTADAEACRFLAAMLNATWLRALAAMHAPEAASGFRRFNASVIERLPFPAGECDGALRALVAEPRTREVRRRIDDRAAELLGLDRGEQDALADFAAAHRR